MEKSCFIIIENMKFYKIQNINNVCDYTRKKNSLISVTEIC